MEESINRLFCIFLIWENSIKSSTAAAAVDERIDRVLGGGGGSLIRDTFSG